MMSIYNSFNYFKLQPFDNNVNFDLSQSEQCADSSSIHPSNKYHQASPPYSPYFYIYLY